MNWIETWVMWKVIFLYVCLGILAIFVLLIAGIYLYHWIVITYKKHSKKYEYDCVRHDYVKKEAKIDEKVK